MTERITAWQCIGCGRMEGAQPCIGVCEDRRREFVYAEAFDAALARIGALEALARAIAHTTPREGECARTWSALQARARRLLDGGR